MASYARDILLTSSDRHARAAISQQVSSDEVNRAAERLQILERTPATTLTSDIAGLTPPQHIAEISITGSLGEMSVFDPGPASATVKALGDVEVWRISQDSLDRLHDARPKVAFRLVSRICACLANRLRKLNQRFVDGS